MNFPTSDLQFLAQMILRTRSNDQIPAADAARLERLAATGSGDEPIDGVPDSLSPSIPGGQV